MLRNVISPRQIHGKNNIEISDWTFSVRSVVQADMCNKNCGDTRQVLDAIFFSDLISR